MDDSANRGGYLTSKLLPWSFAALTLLLLDGLSQKLQVFQTLTFNLRPKCFQVTML